MEAKDKRRAVTRNSHIRRAQKLLQDKRAGGDHGLTGEALQAWYRQRGAIGVCLRIIAAGGIPTRVDYGRMVDARCPQGVANYEPGAGTDAGGRIVDVAKVFVGDVYYGVWYE